MEGNIKLLIFPVNRQLIDFLKISIKNFLSNNKVKNFKITSETSFLVIEVRDHLHISQSLSNWKGIKRIGICQSTSTDIKNMLDGIVCVTEKISHYRKYFKINVISENSNYVPRDIEFMATGLILEKLHKKSLKPKTSKGKDVTEIHCYISRSECYIVYKFIEGIGEFPSRFVKQKIFCLCYDPYSLKSIEIMSDFGFIPQILIIYSSKNDLIKHLKCLYHVFLKMQIKRISLKLLKIKVNFDNNMSYIDELKLLELIFSYEETINVLIPFSFYTHPISIINQIMNFCSEKRKIPWLPLVFSDLNKNSQFFIEKNLLYGLEEKSNSSLQHVPKNRIVTARRPLTLKSIDMKNIKTISFTMTSSNIRPNYIDNILNSI